MVLFDVASGIAKGKALDIAQSSSVDGFNVKFSGTDDDLSMLQHKKDCWPSWSLFYFECYNSKSKKHDSKRILWTGWVIVAFPQSLKHNIIHKNLPKDLNETSE